MKIYKNLLTGLPRLAAVLGLTLVSVVAYLPGLQNEMAGAASYGYVPMTALIDSASVSASGSNSFEQTALEAQGFVVTVIDDATWQSEPQSYFAKFQLLVIGDAACNFDINSISGAVNSESTWAPAISGSILIIGTDPVYHYFGGHIGAGKLINQGLAYAGAQAGKTGLYLDLSCLYMDMGTQDVPIIDGLGFGSATTTGAGCDDGIHIVASAQQLLGITDGDLSNWQCSVHEYFNTWPANFVPFGLDTAAEPLFTAADGSSGAPYILGYGGGLTLGTIGLAAATDPVATGSFTTLTASLQSGGTPISGATVTFTCALGPCEDGSTQIATSDINGVATLSYTSTTVGTDLWTASYVPDTVPVSSSSESIVWRTTTSFSAFSDSSNYFYGDQAQLAASGLPSDATGTVDFTAASGLLCSAEVTGGTATCTTGVINGGGYFVQATYSGDASYLSSSSRVSFTVLPNFTNFSVTSTPSSTAYGSTIDLAVAGLALGATGTVRFTASGGTLCTATVFLGDADCTTAVLPAGFYNVTVTYSGDSNYITTWRMTHFSISQNPSAITGSSGNVVALTVSNLPTGSTGFVTFSLGSTLLCTATDTDGVASCNTSALPVGSNSVDAVYSGDVNFVGSTSTITVNVLPAATAIALSGTATPGLITLSQSGLPSAATGSVIFSFSGHPLCTATVHSGSSSCTVSVLPTGSDLITAVYSGDASYTMASGSTTLTVTLPSFGLTLVFPNSKSVLSKAFVASIKRYVATVKAKQFTHITIVGYSKSGGKASVARTVSIAQASAVAKAVKAQLRAAGVTRVVVTFSGVGATAFHVTPGKSSRNQQTVITAS
jgi:hypothetical protein